MFSLVKCTCASCFEECDCLYCPKCEKQKELYCKKCITDFNKAHRTIGLCPTCKTPYGKQNCYYIYGSDITPVLNAQLNKYRERIQSSPEYEICRLHEHIQRISKEPYSKRPMLLQLYLNRLYKNEYPKEDKLMTWCNGPHECPIITDMFNQLSYDLDSFIETHEMKPLTDSIFRINDDFKHAKLTLDDSVICDENNEDFIFCRKIDPTKPRERTLQRYIFDDKYVSIELVEEPIQLNDFDRGLLKAAIITGRPISDSHRHYEVLSDARNFRSKYDLQIRRDLRTFGRKIIDNWTFIHENDEYVPFTVRYSERRIIKLPVIAKFDESLKTRNFEDEILYVDAISKAIITHLREAMSDQTKMFDNMYYRLMYSAVRVNKYTTRMRYDKTRDKSIKITDMLIEMLKEEAFDITQFMVQLDMYYLNAHPNRWNFDLRRLAEEIERQLFGHLDITDIPTKIKPLLVLAERTPMDVDSSPMFVQIDTTPNIDLFNALSKQKIRHKISTVKCVCGGSVIAKDTTGSNTIYECTCCHKEYNSLPEQEIDPETLKLLEKDSKKCPHCSTYIQKTEGCNHMFCTNCHRGFNWDDLSELNDAENTNPLYREYRHGNGSNLRTLLDDYEFSSDRRRHPIEWFGHVLYMAMKEEEDHLDMLKEQLFSTIHDFMTDDLNALKYINKLNICKMTIAFIQRTFDNMIEKAFEIAGNQPGRGGGDGRTARKRLIDRLCNEYSAGFELLDMLPNTIGLQISCMIEKAKQLSNGIDDTDRSDSLISLEMRISDEQMEADISKQLSIRAEELAFKDTEVITIGDRKITVRRT